MIKTALVLSLLLTPSAFAQRGTTADIGSEAQRLASEIQRESRRLTRGQVADIQNKFREIRDVIYGSSGGGSVGNYSCISRDNDNRAPYVYAIRDGINMIRVNAMQFASVESCQASIAATKYIGGLALSCVSRDNDDRAPWVFVRLEGQNVTKLTQATTQSMQECKALMDRMIVLNYQSDVAFCKARDNDNRAPYVAVNMNLASGQMKVGSESFNDIESCWRFLGN